MNSKRPKLLQSLSRSNHNENPERLIVMANPTYHKRDLYTEVTARILSELEAGAAPWIKPWSATPGLNHPHNAATARPYSGCNVVLLWMTMQRNGYASPRFLTFKQAQELGGSVRKGEHGTKVYFVKKLIVKDRNSKEEDATRSIPMMKEYTVFNVSQCEGLPDRVLNPQAKAPRNKDIRDPLADEFLTATQADIREGHGQAYYIPSQDYIALPSFSSFRNSDNFYSTCYHELGHWTGAKSRLDRSEGMRSRFGERSYAAEELIAELCAAFLCAEFDMDGELRHAGYIQNWIELLKADARAFFTACSKAQAAADYLRGLALAELYRLQPEISGDPGVHWNQGPPSPQASPTGGKGGQAMTPKPITIEERNERASRNPDRSPSPSSPRDQGGMEKTADQVLPLLPLGASRSSGCLSRRAPSRVDRASY